MKIKHKKKPAEHIRIANERIEELFKQADAVFNKDPSLANRYVYLARKISMKYKVKIPSTLKRKFCKHCYSYLRPGKNCRARIAKHRVVYYCLNCKRFMRFVIKKRHGGRP
ncbi:MAG: ribonuclease P [Candidatus Woesearchaeota archaeon]|nr:ribonuclease P [Candidatus Woesearchaeota archaeon]